MATIHNFEDMEIWQLSRALCKDIRPVLLKLEELKSYDLNRQLSRSSGSVMDNIAEGFERDGNKEFVQFLAISKGSLAEVRPQLYRVLDSNLIKQEEFDKLQSQCKLISGKIGRFITYLKNSGMRGKKFQTSSNKSKE